MFDPRGAAALKTVCAARFEGEGTKSNHPHLIYKTKLHRCYFCKLGRAGFLTFSLDIVKIRLTNPSWFKLCTSVELVRAARGHRSLS